MTVIYQVDFCVIINMKLSFLTLLTVESNDMPIESSLPAKITQTHQRFTIMSIANKWAQCHGFKFILKFIAVISPIAWMMAIFSSPEPLGS